MAESNGELIDELRRDGYLNEPLIIDAFKNIDRKDFVLEEYQDEAYGNYPLPIGFDQTISQPLTVAFMLAVLTPQPGEKILDIGTGSGWVAGLLAHIVGQEGRVVSIDRINGLIELARKNVSKYGFVEEGTLKLVFGDGSKGYKAVAPYDKIIAAAAGEEVPMAWKKQLKTGGRIVAPIGPVRSRSTLRALAASNGIGQSIVVLDKISEKEFKEKEYFGFSFVPLVRD